MALLLHETIPGHHLQVRRTVLLDKNIVFFCSFVYLNIILDSKINNTLQICHRHVQAHYTCYYILCNSKAVKCVCVCVLACVCKWSFSTHHVLLSIWIIRNKCFVNQLLLNWSTFQISIQSTQAGPSYRRHNLDDKYFQPPTLPPFYTAYIEVRFENLSYSHCLNVSTWFQWFSVLLYRLQYSIAAGEGSFIYG